jgi:hypothetical protein
MGLFTSCFGKKTSPAKRKPHPHQPVTNPTPSSQTSPPAVVEKSSTTGPIQRDRLFPTKPSRDSALVEEPSRRLAQIDLPSADKPAKSEKLSRGGYSGYAGDGGVNANANANIAAQQTLMMQTAMWEPGNMPSPHSHVGGGGGY